jgi:hypothetical protein
LWAEHCSGVVRWSTHDLSAIEAHPSRIAHGIPPVNEHWVAVGCMQCALTFGIDRSGGALYAPQG